MQPRKPFVFLSFAGEDSNWVKKFRSVNGFEKMLNPSKIYDYVASPEVVRDLNSIRGEVNRADIFFAFLSKYYLPDQTDRKEIPLTLDEFETAMARFGSGSGDRPVLVLVMLDGAGLRWWDDRRLKDDIPDSLRRKAYFSAKDKTRDQPVEANSIWYDVLDLAKQARDEWESVAATAPPDPPTIPPPVDREIILVGHPAVQSDREVKESLDDVERLLAGKNQVFRRWPDGWSTPASSNGDEPKHPSPDDVASLIKRGSEFVRAVDAGEAYQVVAGDPPLDLRRELIKVAKQSLQEVNESKSMLGRSRLTIWLPPTIQYPPFRERASADVTCEDTVLRVDPASQLVNWLVGGGPDDLPTFAMERIQNSQVDRVRLLLARLLKEGLGDTGGEEKSLKFNTFSEPDDLLVGALQRSAGRAIMVAHDLREEIYNQREDEAINKMTGKLTELWTTAQKANGMSCKPFLIAMISRYYDYFWSIDYPQPSAGPWHVMRVRPSDPKAGLEEDKGTWKPLVKDLEQWWNEVRGRGPSSANPLSAGVGRD
jgi:hypothetical protein